MDRRPDQQMHILPRSKRTVLFYHQTGTALSWQGNVGVQGKTDVQSSLPLQFSSRLNQENGEWMDAKIPPSPSDSPKATQTEPHIGADHSWNDRRSYPRDCGEAVAHCAFCLHKTVKNSGEQLSISVFSPQAPDS